MIQAQALAAGEAPQLQVPPGGSEVSGMFFHFHALQPSLGAQDFSKESPRGDEQTAATAGCV